MKVIIDRFEGRFAVVQMHDRRVFNVERSKIPDEAREGDILVIEGDKIILDKENTDKRKSEIEEIMKDLWK